jgi:iron(III) transport system ATP-binding protein
MTTFLDVKNLRVQFGKTQVLQDISMEISQGEIVCLLGPSGSGKTTLLRSIAGFQAINGGSIRLKDFSLSAPGLLVRPEARGIGLVFQDFALFPHLNVAENIAFGLSSLKSSDRKARVDYLLELVELESLRTQYPFQLSGGEKQRVALARALAPDPRLLLLDEPLSQLDPDLRTNLARQIRQILKRIGTTALMVTHSQSEAFDFGDRVAVLYEGRLQQFSSAYDLYHQPETSFVADFVGRGSFLEAEVVSPQSIRMELGIVAGEVPAGMKCGDRVITLVRPDDVIFDKESPLFLRVLSRSFRGPYFLYQLETPQKQKVLSLIPSHHRFEEGDSIPVRLKMDHLICFSQQANLR